MFEGNYTRRDVLKRGSVLGATLVAGGVLVACGSDDGSDSASEGGTLARIRRDGFITLGFYGEAPVSFSTGPGELSGWSIDLFTEVFKPVNVEINPVLADFGGLIPGLQAKRWDAIGAGMGINAERCRAVTFGAPDFRGADAFIVRKNDASVRGVTSYADIAATPDVKIAVTQGSTQQLYVEAAKIPKDQVVLIGGGDSQSIYAGLQAERYNIVPGFNVTDEWTIRNTIRDPNLTSVTLSEPPKTPDGGTAAVVYGGAAFRNADRDLIDFYNKRMGELLASGEQLRILEKYGAREDALPPAGLTGKQVCGDLEAA